MGNGEIGTYISPYEVLDSISMMYPKDKALFDLCKRLKDYIEYLLKQK